MARLNASRRSYAEPVLSASPVRKVEPMMRYIVLGLLIATTVALEAQVVGEYRSNQSGEWNALNTWEQWDGSNWITAYPVYSPGSVTISGDGYPVVAGTANSAKTVTMGTTHTIGLPGSIQAGDLLLIFWTDANDVGTAPAAPTGFTQLYSNTSGSRIRRAWYKVADGTEGASINVTAGAERSAHTAYRITAGTYQGVPVASAVDADTDDTPNPPSLTSGFGAVPTMWIATSHSAGDGTVTAPTNYTANLIVGHSAGTGNSDATTGTSHRFTTAATEDPGSYDLSANRNHAAWTVAIEGTAAGGTYPNPVPVRTATGAQSTANVFSHTITIPTGETGDLIVVIFSVDANPTVTAFTSGWTKLGQASNGTSVTGAVFHKIATGTASGDDPLILTTTTQERSSHITYRIRGATGISGTSSNGSSTDSDPANHTASEACLLWIASRSGDNTAVADVPPTNYSSLRTVPAGDAAGASTNAAVRVLGTAAASENPDPFNSPDEQWVCYTLAILGPAPDVTMVPIDPPASGNGEYPIVAGTASSTKLTTGSAAHMISLPSGIQAGDLLMIFFSESDDSGTDPAFPTGYIQMYANEEGADRFRGAWYRIADGTEGATVSTTNNFAGRSAHTAYRIAAGSYQGLPVVSTLDIGTDNSVDPPNLTSGFGAVPTMWIAACHSAGTGTMTPGVNYTTEYFDAYTGNFGDDDARMGTSHRFTAAASENPPAFTLGANWPNVGATIAIRGAPVKATVRNGHTVTVQGPRSIDDMVVESGGTLTIDPGTLTVNGTSLTVNGALNGATGTLILGGTLEAAIAVTGSATLAVRNITVNTAGGVTMGTNAFIHGTLQLNDGVFTAVGFVTLRSTTNNTGRLGPVDPAASYSGNLRVERYIPAGATNWRLLGSPVAGNLVYHWQDDFITAGYPGSQYPWFDDPVGSGILWPSIRHYDEPNPGPLPNDGVIGVTNSSQSLAAGKGFAVWCGDMLGGTAPFTIDLTGTPNIALSPISLPMSWTNTGVPGTDGWNLVSNPVPSPIAFDQISRGANVEDYVSYYDPASGNVATWDISLGSGTNGGTNTIQASQGFWLKANGSSVTTTVSESDKIVGNTGGFFGGDEETTLELLRLRITSGMNTYSDETVVVFSVGAPEVESEDVRKMIFSLPAAPQIGTFGSPTELLAINAYGSYTTAISIPVMVDAGVSGTYTVTATGYANMGLRCLTLEDLLTGEITPLGEGTAYSFEMDAEADASVPRLILHATAPLSFESIDATCGGMANGQATVVITEGPADVTWTDEFGAVLSQQTGVMEGDVTFGGLAAGSYMVHVTSNTACGELVSDFTIDAPFVLDGTTVSNSATTCADAEDGSIDMMVMGGVEPYTYAWSNGADTEDLIAGAGSYTLTVTDANNCEWASDVVTIDAGGAVAGFTVVDPVVLVNTEVIFTNTSVSGETFFWEFGDGATSTEVEPVHAYALPGTYTVTLTVTSGDCSDVTSFDVTVELNTGISTSTAVELSAWVSANGFVVEHGFTSGIVYIEVLDATGRLHATRNVGASPGRVILPHEGLSTGIWFVRVTNGDKQQTFRLPLLR